MNMNQVAMYYSFDEEKESIKKALGLQNEPWIKDIVESEVRVRQDSDGNYTNGINVSELEFCLAMGGAQFELIRKIRGPSWLDYFEGFGPNIAHIGVHLDDGEEWPEIDATLMQEARTIKHENPAVNEANRRYHYRIYLVKNCFFKYIRRITLP